MKIASLFTLFVLTCIGAFAQLDTVFRLTKRFDEATNRLSPDILFASVTNARGDTLHLSEYFWTENEYRWMAYIRRDFLKTDSSSVVLKSSWKRNEQKWVVYSKTEYIRLDSVDCEFIYEIDEQSAQLRPVKGTGVCAEGYLPYFNEKHEIEIALFKNIKIDFAWNPRQKQWEPRRKTADNYSEVTDESQNIQFSYVSGEWILYSQNINNIVCKYADPTKTYDIYKYIDTLFYDGGYRIRFNPVNYLYQVKEFNTAGWLVSDSLFNTFSNDTSVLFMVTRNEYLYDTLLFKSEKNYIYSKEVHFFDSAGVLKEVITSGFVEGDNWMPKTKEVYIEVSPLLKQTFFYVWNEADSTWLYQKKEEFSFDDEGNEIANAAYFWNNQTNSWQGEHSRQLVFNDEGQYWISYDSCSASNVWLNGNGTQLLYKQQAGEAVGEIVYRSESSKTGPVPVYKNMYRSDSAYVFDVASNSFLPVKKVSYLYYADKKPQEKVLYEYNFQRDEWSELSSTEWYYGLAGLEEKYEIVKEYVPTAIEETETARTALRLYPTIASKAVWLENSGLAVDASVYSADGKLMQMQEMSAKCRTEINVADLSNGLYYLKISGQEPLMFIKAD